MLRNVVNTDTLLQLTWCDASQLNAAVVLVEGCITASERKRRPCLVGDHGAECKASEDSVLQATFVQVRFSCSERKVVGPKDVDDMAYVERLGHVRQVRISKRVEIIKSGEIVVIVGSEAERLAVGVVEVAL